MWKRDKETGAYYNEDRIQIRQDGLGKWIVIRPDSKGRYLTKDSVIIANTRKKAMQAYEAGMTGFIA